MKDNKFITSLCEPIAADSIKSIFLFVPLTKPWMLCIAARISVLLDRSEGQGSHWSNYEQQKWGKPNILCLRALLVDLS